MMTCHLFTDWRTGLAQNEKRQGKAKLQLTISLSSSAHQALDTQGLASYFKGVGTSQDITGKPERKIEFTVQRMEF